MKKQHIVILGVTGSIGDSTLKVVKAHPEQFEISGIANYNNIDKLSVIAKEFAVKRVVCADLEKLAKLRELLPPGIQSDAGTGAMLDLVSLPEVDTVVCAIVGTGGLLPVIAAIRAGKRIALASKEVMVLAGDLIRRELSNHPQAQLIPVDSEHSAIFQCLHARNREEIKYLWLTASGGAFRSWPCEAMRRATLADALRHPTWSMGKKVTIDSASLMNKALELVEAKYLFDVLPQQLKVVVHPQSVVHSMVEFVDGSFISQMSKPDMCFAIQYALSYPHRWAGNLPQLDFAQMSKLEFELPDHAKYPSLDFAEAALTAGGTMPGVMNAANEIAVDRFCRGEIDFIHIYDIIEQTMARHIVEPQTSLEQIQTVDRWAREVARSIS